MLALTPRPESTVYPRTPALMAQAATDADRARIDRAQEPAIAAHYDGLGSACIRRELYGEETD